MNVRSFITKSAFAATVIAANLVIFSTGDAEARRGAGGPGYHRPAGPPSVASAHTTVRPASVVSGCGNGHRCATTRANGGVVVTTRGGQGPGPRRR